MTSDELLDQWRRDAAAPFQGWDFSYLNGRMIEDEPPTQSVEDQDAKMRMYMARQ